MKQNPTTDVQGEGNYTAAKQYDDATTKHAQSGKVEQEARDAAPKSVAEAEEMRKAEAEGKSHAKGLKGGESNSDHRSADVQAPPRTPPVAEKVGKQ